MKCIILFLFLPFLAFGQDTITLNPGHQLQLPELLEKAESLQKEQKQVSELIVTMILGYLKTEEQMTALREGRIAFTDDRKKIVITKKAEK